MVSSQQAVFEPTLTEGHSCPYERVGRRYLQESTGHTPLGFREEKDLVKRLRVIHLNGECPPTHLGGSPTREWAEFVKEYSS